MSESKFFQAGSSAIIRVIKARRMSWVGHVTHMEEVRNA
jgi:hypothetical protein